MTRVCLVISDHESATGLASALAPEGIRCSVVGTVTEAARHGDVDGYDLIVLDANVYGDGTATACRRLAGTWPRCHLIVLADDTHASEPLREAGAARVVELGPWQRGERPRLLAILLENLIANSDLEAFRGVLRTVLENIDDGIVLTDRAGQPLLSNLSARRLLEAHIPASRGDDEPGASDVPMGHFREIPLTDGAGSRFGAMLHLRAGDAGPDVRPFQPFHDPLTGLPGGEAFVRSLGRTLVQRQRDGGRCAVLLMDFDRFGSVRDTLGTAFADRMVASMAAALARGVRRGDLMARLARDEFAILIDHLTEETELVHVARKLLALVRRAAREDSSWPDLTASVGIAVSPDQGETPEAMLEAADHALRQAKAQGGNGYSFCSEEFQQNVSRYLDLHLALQGALARDEFRLHFQPIVDLGSGRVGAFEALLRWRAPTLGEVAPAEFVPILEHTGLIQPVGEWVLERACEQIRSFQQRFARPDLSVSVNLSVRQIQDDSLVGVVRRVLQRSGLASRCLMLEVTESLLMTEPRRAANILQRLALMGAHISIDDFGAGYSSLSYIKTLPVSGLKIDRAFLSGVPDQPRDVSIVRGTLALAHSLGLTVTAEGVESPAQLSMLEELGCDRAQGYLLGRPGPPDAAARRLEAGPR